jgi:para-aminobenzoate synthetase component 1
MAVTQDSFSLSPNQVDNLRDGLAGYATRWNHAAVLDSCGLESSIFPVDNQHFSLLAGFSDGKLGQALKFIGQNDIPATEHWYFGHLSYELKDKIEPGLHSSKPAALSFSDERFWPAEIVFLLRNDDLQVITFNGEIPANVLKEVLNSSSLTPSGKTEETTIFSREKYLSDSREIQQHLRRGDIYELNYCIPFFSSSNDLNITALWRNLNHANPAPQSALYREGDNWLICASPERFLKRNSKTLYSQPIKGTTARHPNPATDAENATALVTSEKERAENIMITDLVRNDLSRIAKRGTVKVDELCGLYGFRHVYQLITTVSAELPANISMRDILSALFPMGSMTGAPKYKAMEIIEQKESFRRELFSGSVGYIAPNGNFDLNVVIRSILYNASSGKIIIPAGSAITAKSDAEKEYDECLLKAKALIQLINSPLAT